MPKDTVVFTVKAPAKLVKPFDEIARSLERSRNAHLRYLMERENQRHRARGGKT